jgi:hypothetical protein
MRERVRMRNEGKQVGQERVTDWRGVGRLLSSSSSCSSGHLVGLPTYVHTCLLTYTVDCIPT